MKKDYMACRDHNNRSGNNKKTIKHMDELDAILGHRPSVSPRVMLQSMARGAGSDSDTAANVSASDTASDDVDSWDDANDEDNRDARAMVGRRDSPETGRPPIVTPARRIKRPLVTYVSM